MNQGRPIRLTDEQRAELERWVRSQTRDATTGCAGTRPTMREIASELKALRLYGMAGAWNDMTAIGGQARIESALWLIEHLLDAEGTYQVMRSIRYQMTAARFPVHRDLAGFDFGQSCVDRRLS